MAAPKGNQFWKLRSKHGRNKLFETPELLWKAACEYFQWCDDNPIEVEDNKGTKHVNIVKLKRPYTIKAFLLYVDASSSWLSDFKKNAPEDFLEVIRKIESIIYVQKFEGAAIGIFQHNIIARDLGLIESSKVDHTTRGDKINITFVEK